MNAEITWPERPICHDNDPGATRFLGVPLGTPPVVYTTHRWEAPKTEREPYGESFRRCSYCGSIHPQDFYEALKASATLDAADRKYGWPHKFYVRGIPNLLMGKQVRIGSESGPNPDGTIYHRDIIGDAPPTVMAKWYNQHLFDLNEAAFQALTLLIREQTGIFFEMRGDSLFWSRE